MGRVVDVFWGVGIELMIVVLIVFWDCFYKAFGCVLILIVIVVVVGVSFQFYCLL